MQKAIVEINAEVGHISGNLEEVKAYLNEELEVYRTAKFTDESIKTAKGVRADLRADRDDLKKRITIAKKRFMQPWDEFNEKLNEIVSLYEEPINQIDAQVKDFETRQKEEKRKQISELYKELFTGFEEYTLESIFNPKWENATYKMNEVKKDLITIHEEIQNAITTISSFCSDAGDKAMDMYKQNRNLSEAILYIQRYELQKREILEKERQAKEEQIRAEERERLLAEQKAEEEKAMAIEKAKEETEQAILESMAAPINPEEPTRDVIYCITLSETQREALEIYMDSCGIEWEVLNG